MSKNKAIILIPIVLLLGAAAIIATIFLLKNQPASQADEMASQTKVDVSELQFGLEWGTHREQVEKYMEEQGYETSKNTMNTLISYNVEDFCGIEGADGYVAFVFSIEDELKDVQYGFTSTQAYGACSVEVIDLLTASFEKALNANYEKSFFDFDGYEYWLGDKTFVTYLYEDSERIVVVYTDCASEPEIVESLKVMQ